ncbi:molybdopterin oxidoreductase family protein [Halarchaeum sp. P4]|uniref:molybdopterin oxidoreductase family protein n=1 Tax=Halarchaeum sp. P4 TaxID=3421639 RepID=UPI003EC02CE2
MQDAHADGTASETETVCPLCAVGCHLARGDGAGRARGVPGPANPNGRLCAKGANAFEAVEDDDRLTQPLVREDGDLVETTWESALDRATDGFEDVLDSHGPEALAFLGAPHCSNEENYLLQKLARTLGTNTVDNRARLCHDNAADALEARFGHPASTLGLPDLEASDLVIVVGANPAVQQPVAFNAFVRGSDGALVHIDPRANETTRAADDHLAPRPGTDALLLQCVAATLVADGDYDADFVAERTTGFEAYRESLAALDVERAAAATDVPVADVRRLAERIADADGVAVIAGTGVEADDGATVEALLDVLCLTGNVDREGAGFALFRGLNNEQGATDVGCRPDRLPGHASLADPDARERVEAVWGVEVPTEPGLNETEALGVFGEEVHGALVVGENPAVAKRDADWTAERLDSLSTLVVVDVYETETTEHADVVLPAAVGLEKSGTVTNLDRRVQALAAVADPPGNARTDFETLCALGQRLVGDGFDYTDPSEARAELRRVSPLHANVEVGEQWDYTGFDTPDGRAAFSPADVDVEVDDGDALALVVGSRAGGFGAADVSADENLHLNPADADARGLSDGDAVRVSTDGASVETTLTVEDGVREGVAYLHADVADPLVRAGAATVDVEAAGE